MGGSEEDAWWAAMMEFPNPAESRQGAIRVGARRQLWKSDSLRLAQREKSGSPERRHWSKPTCRASLLRGH